MKLFTEKWDDYRVQKQLDQETWIEVKWEPCLLGYLLGQRPTLRQFSGSGTVWYEMGKKRLKRCPSSIESILSDIEHDWEYRNK